ncbi:MAG TPA: hypothetical protein VGC32_00725 [Solirubrobacterales bacterium]
MRRLPPALALLALALVTFGTGTAQAQCGEGQDGELAFQRSGKLLVGACGPDQQAAVLRLDGAGKLDSSFAGDGSLGPWPSSASPHLTTAPGGKVLVEMRLGLGRRPRVVLRRFSADGTLDKSFAGGNAVVPTNPHDSSIAGALRVFSQPGGTSVVAYRGSFDGCFGSFCAERTYFIRMFRYSATGKRIGEARYYTEYWDLNGLAMAPDGGLIVTGDDSEYATKTYLRTKPNLKARVHKDSKEGAVPRGLVAAGPGTTIYAGGNPVTRYHLGGTVDPSFGAGGSAVCEGEYSYFRLLQSLDSGGLLAVGPEGPCGLAEFRPGGSLDPAFGPGGSGMVNLQALHLIPSRYRLESVAVGPSGEIAISYRYEEEAALKILRFSPRGRLEPGFGNGGAVTIRDFRPA